jgi:hypothetical protein
VVRDVGHGSLQAGERVLDLFVKKVRAGAPTSAEATPRPAAAAAFDRT